MPNRAMEYIAVQDVLNAYFVINGLTEDDITLLNTSVGNSASRKLKKLLNREFNDVADVNKTHGKKRRDGSFGDHKKNVYPNQANVRKLLFKLYSSTAKDKGIRLPIREGDLRLRVRLGEAVAYVYSETGSRNVTILADNF